MGLSRDLFYYLGLLSMADSLQRAGDASVPICDDCGEDIRGEVTEVGGVIGYSVETFDISSMW